MNALLDEQSLSCPYCGQTISVLVDATSAGQEYIEDCEVCCRPMHLTVFDDNGFPYVHARHEDE